MIEEFESIILCRNDKGRFVRQIKLGNKFLSDINQMSNAIFQIKNDYISLENQLNLLNWKINSLISTRILYNYKGINFPKQNEEMSYMSKNYFSKVIENINESLYALLTDFHNDRIAGGPGIIHDHIVFLLCFYEKLKSREIFKSIVSQEQQEMIEALFIECIELFNKRLSYKKWEETIAFAVSVFFQLLGKSYEYEPSNTSPYELENCKFDYELNKISYQNKPQ